MSTTTLFLVCHEPLATALHAVGCHAFPQGLAGVRAIDVLAGATPDDVAQQIDAAHHAAGSPSEVLLLTDLQGATPSNGVDLWCQQRAAQGHRCPPAVAGVSLPLLLRAVTHQHQPAEALAQELLGCSRAHPCRIENPESP